MPRTDQQNEEIRAATRTAVVQSAIRLFAQNGYAATTTRAIAREAGISAGLMYHYFDSKESLLRAVFDHIMAILNEAVTAAMVVSPPNGQTAAVLRTIFTLLADDAPFWTLFYALRSQPAITPLLAEAFCEVTNQLRLLFEAEYRQAGYADPVLESYVLYSLLEGTIQPYLLNPETYPLAVVTERILATVPQPVHA